eukprot:g3283.t1
MVQKLLLQLRSGCATSLLIDTARNCSTTGKLDASAQNAVCDALRDPLVSKHPPRNIGKFVRKFCSLILEENEEIHEELAEFLVSYVSSPSDDSTEAWGTNHYVPYRGDEALDVVSVRLSTDLSAGSTGCHEWDAGFWLGELALSQPELFQDKRVVEIGAGSGLATVCISRAKPKYFLATDGSSETLTNLRYNLEINGIDVVSDNTVDLGLVDWETHCADDLRSMNADLVCASDILYCPENCKSSTRVIKCLLDSNSENSKCLVVHTIRNSDTLQLFFRECDEIGLDVEDVTAQFEKRMDIEFKGQVNSSEILCFQLTLTKTR